MFTEFAPTRSAALERLAEFVPLAGREYATRRNFDLPGVRTVSRLSPWIRHRILTEEEVVAAVLARHSLRSAEKFIDEVTWRTYWKGWLELRPAIWQQYRTGLAAAIDRLAVEEGMRERWEAACEGRTGIDGFDHWARELVATGYLHNHARMWFASIWIFTLRLPWELGADFFLRHLLDGDPASNTLSWRWVGGMHTRGKTYLARASNIAEYTGGRYRPEGLATDARPLPDRHHPAPRPPPRSNDLDPTMRTGLLLTEEDLSPDFLFARGLRPVAATALLAVADRSPLAVSPRVHDWVTGAIDDCAGRHRAQLGSWTAPHEGEAALLFLRDWALGFNLGQIVTAYAPTGPTADLLDKLRKLLEPHGVRLITCLRNWDRDAWPHATRGFFQFKLDIVRQVEAAARR
ncbi:MAG: FAD-binding domain-containing protein [Gemmobacter sp.]